MIISWTINIGSDFKKIYKSFLFFLVCLFIWHQRRQETVQDNNLMASKRHFEKGQMIDIMDINDVYCPAIIQTISVDKTKLGVTYIGWSQEWDETIDANSERILIEKRTIMVKGWVKLNPKLVFWPCKIFVRYTSKDSEKGEAYLRSERRVFLLPYGPEFNQIKPYMHGVWITTANILMYDTKKINLRISEGEASTKFSAYFKEAVRQCESDPGSIHYKFKFEGSLDVEEKRQEIKSLLLQKKLEEKEEKLLRQQQYKAIFSTGGEYGSSRRRQHSGEDDSLGSSSKRLKSGTTRMISMSESHSPPIWSKYYLPFKMFQSSLQNIHPAGADSIQNVVRVLEAQKQSLNEVTTTSSSTGGSSNNKKKSATNSDTHNNSALSKLGFNDLSKLFPFKISSLCASVELPIATFRDAKKSKGKSTISTGSLKSFPVNPRKPSNPRHVEIKRASAYSSITRMKQSLSR